MSFSFQIQKPKDMAQTLARLKTEAAKHNIAFKGDETRGGGSGYGFTGEYTVNPNSILLTIHKKPFIIAESKIKEKVREFMAKIESEINENP